MFQFWFQVGFPEIGRGGRGQSKKNLKLIQFSEKIDKDIMGPNFLDAQASLAPTHVSLLVRR